MNKDELTLLSGAGRRCDRSVPRGRPVQYTNQDWKRRRS